MYTLRPSAQRGQAEHGWLSSQHTFSFADYHDPAHMHFRALRVINEDIIAPGKGFDTHPHRDMEILTYIISGELAHKDSMGHGRTIKSGELQYMSAGTGVNHSEFNPSQTTPVHLLQIWIIPDSKNLPPAYADWKPLTGQAPLTTLVSPDSRDTSVSIHRDVSLFLGLMKKGQTLTHNLQQNRHAWLQMISGSLNAGGVDLKPGDGLAITEEKALELQSHESSSFLLFDLD